MPKSQPLDMWEQFDPDAPLRSSCLHDFFKDPKNSVVRERIFTHRLLSDLKVAAAMSGYHLQTYEPDVDRDGHDVVLEDDTRTVNLQLKTLYGQTRAWDIRKRLLRPDARYAHYFGIENASKNPDIELQTDEGLQGGVVVIQAILRDGMLAEIKYLYTDIFIIFAICAGLVPGKNPAKTTLVSQAKNSVRIGAAADRVTLDKTCFVHAIDSERLLALIGLSSRFSSAWRLNVPRYLCTEALVNLADGERESSMSRFAYEINANLQQLIRLDNGQQVAEAVVQHSKE